MYLHSHPYFHTDFQNVTTDFCSLTREKPNKHMELIVIRISVYRSMHYWLTTEIVQDVWTHGFLRFFFFYIMNFDCAVKWPPALMHMSLTVWFYIHQRAVIHNLQIVPVVHLWWHLGFVVSLSLAKEYKKHSIFLNSWRVKSIWNKRLLWNVPFRKIIKCYATCSCHLSHLIYPLGGNSHLISVTVSIEFDFLCQGCFSIHTDERSVTLCSPEMYDWMLFHSRCVDRLCEPAECFDRK